MSNLSLRNLGLFQCQEWINQQISFIYKTCMNFFKDVSLYLILVHFHNKLWEFEGSQKNINLSFL